MVPSKLKKFYRFVFPALCLAFVCMNLLSVKERGESVVLNTDDQILWYFPGIGGEQELEYTWRSSVDRLHLFRAVCEEVEDFPMGEIIRFEIIKSGSGELVYQHEYALSYYNRNTMLCDWVCDIDLEKGEDYRFVLKMPSTKPGAGLRFAYEKVSDGGESLVFGGANKPKAKLFFQVTKGNPHPRDFLVIGSVVVLISGLLLLDGPLLWWGVFLLGSTLAMEMSMYQWQERCMGFWGNYWPDEYVRIAKWIQEYLFDGGELQQLIKRLSTHRNGEVFFVPLGIAVLNRLGLSYEVAFWGISIGSIMTAVSVSVVFLRRYAGISWKLLSFGTVCLLVNFFTTRVALSMTTDAAALGMGIFFVFSYLLYLESKSIWKRFCWGILVVSFLFLGVATRLSLMPALVLPVCVGGWMLVLRRYESISEVVLAVIPGLISAVGLWSFYRYGGLMGSFQAAHDFSQLPQFRAMFGYGLYLLFVVVSLQSAWISGIKWIPGALRDRRLAVLAGFWAGMVLLLLMGHICVWVRYWCLPAFLANLLGVYGLSSMKHQERIGLITTLLLVIFNVGWFYFSPTLT